MTTFPSYAQICRDIEETENTAMAGDEIGGKMVEVPRNRDVSIEGHIMSIIVSQ